MRKLVVALLCLLAWPALAQLPPSDGIVVNQTNVQGGTTDQCLYIMSTRKVGSQACSTGSVTTWSGGTTGLLPSAATGGAITVTGVLLGANGGTGVANTGKTITLGGNLTTSGAFASTFTMTNTTSVTFPTSGTLATTSSPIFTGTVTLPVGSTVGTGSGQQYLFINGGNSGATDGACLFFQNAGVTNGYLGNPSACAGGAFTSNIELFATGALILSSTNFNVTAAGALTAVGTVRSNTGFNINGTAGASCGAGTLNPATAVVTNGIITTC